MPYSIQSIRDSAFLHLAAGIQQSGIHRKIGCSSLPGRLLKLFALVCVLTAFWTFPITTNGQSQSLSATNEEITALEEKFTVLQEEFREIVLEAQRIGFVYLNEPTIDKADPHIREFEEITVRGNEVLERWIPIGLKLFNKKNDAGQEIDDDLGTFVNKIVTRLFDNGDFEAAFQLADRLFKIHPENVFAEVYRARSGLMTNRFDKSITDSLQRNAEHLGEEDFLSNVEVMMINNVFFLNEEFEKEKMIREKEAKADDLPRVKIVTNKGEMIIELFENEAPETVGHFVNLVEKGYYDGLIFHTVIHHTAAEAGGLDEDFNPRPIGYNIYDENQNANARKIFAGSVVMNSPEDNTGGERFFVSLASLVELSGKHTVFGRVVSGLENAYQLNKTFEIVEQKQLPLDGAVPDKIISATVLRKRNHEYAPRKVPQN